LCNNNNSNNNNNKIPVIIGETGTISNSLKYPSNIAGKHEIKKLQKKNNHTGHCTLSAGSANVEVQKHISWAKYTTNIQTWFVSGIQFVNILHKGNDDDDDNNNNNNDPYHITVKPLLTLILLTSTKWWASASASKWRMGFNSVFKRLNGIWTEWNPAFIKRLSQTLGSLILISNTCIKRKKATCKGEKIGSLRFLYIQVSQSVQLLQVTKIRLHHKRTVSVYAHVQLSLTSYFSINLR
jgi:hypothetical protein